MKKSGARKSVDVGRALIPLGDGASGFTTNASTAPRILPSAGVNLAIYNNSGAVGAVTVGDNTMTAQAPGAVQVSGSNVFVGVPCSSKFMVVSIVRTMELGRHYSCYVVGFHH